MHLKQLFAVAPVALAVLALPCQAGPCSKDIERVQVLIDARLNAIAASGPSADQSAAAQLHRQPTPRSMAEAESRLGELSPDTIAKVSEAMSRARAADGAGDKDGCDRALAEIQGHLGR
ncbi:MAG TPA: hypothetical protein VFB31_17120 [Pseudolabrys sp.]|nr:hypothetical protein [Pseudolabrys sp.]